MKLSEKLLIVAEWLESSENDLLVKAEQDETCLLVVASALVKAAAALKEASTDLEGIEPEVITDEKLNEMAALAQAFDESDDELLKKQASVLDEILLTLAAPRNTKKDFIRNEDLRIEELKKKYNGPKEEIDKMNKVSDSLQAIEKAPVAKKYRPLEAPLNTRYCHDHPGAMIARIGENTWQCMLDKKVYNYQSGFKTLEGGLVPGGSVEEQTKDSKDQEPHTIFDSRESRLNQ